MVAYFKNEIDISAHSIFMLPLFSTGGDSASSSKMQHNQLHIYQ